MGKYEMYSHACKVNARPKPYDPKPTLERPLPYYRCWVCGSVWMYKNWHQGRCPLGCVDTLYGYSTAQVVRASELKAA